MVNRKTRKLRGGNEQLFIFSSNKISTDPNTDQNYMSKGIVHITESVGISALRTFATGLTGAFGGKGYDTTIFDKVRNDALKKLNGLLNNKQKICGLRMEFTMETNIIFVHLCGTLFESK